MTDTPVPRPPSRLDAIKSFIGDLARPFAIISVAATTSYAVIDAGTGADKLTAAGLILAALFGAKTLENQTQARQAATVAVAQTKAQSGDSTPLAAQSDTLIATQGADDPTNYGGPRP